MNYLAMLYDDPSTGAAPGTPAFDALLQAYFAFEQKAGDASVGGVALEPPDQAFTVRGGETPVVSDGPFAETTEVIGGFYVLDAVNLDEAIELAGQIPAASTGAVEVRPMVEWGEKPAETTPAGPGGAPLTRYLALLHYRESAAAVPGTAEWDAGAEQHRRFSERVGEILRAGGALHPAATATTVRVRGGERVLSDGPFLETAETIGGLYIIAAAGRDAAVEVASHIPIDSGAVELFPIMELAS